ncbi:MAG: helix-turn-helix domain-containing protein [Kiritimatiellia bacterium]
MDEKKAAKSSCHSKTVRNIRKKVGMTQSALSKALGISIRAVQSYEQGWRKVPTHIMVQMLVLAAAYHSKTARKPCWEIMKCHPEWLKKCPCYKTDGKLCWLVTGGQSAPRKGEDTDIEVCLKCPVVQEILN